MFVCENLQQNMLMWGRYRDMIVPALEHGNGLDNETTLVAGLVSGENRIAVSENAAIVIRLLRTPIMNRKDVFVFAAGGDLKEIIAQIPELEEWARSQGASSIELSGRMGWMRALAGHGFEFSSVNLRKDI